MYYYIYFEICSPSSFLKLRLSLLLNVQNNEKNYEGAESEETKKNKIIIFNSSK